MLGHHLTLILFFCSSVALGDVDPSPHHHNQFWPGGEATLEVRHQGDSGTEVSAREEVEPIPGMFYKLLTRDYYPKNLGAMGLGPYTEDPNAFWVAILTSPGNFPAHLPQFPVSRYMNMNQNDQYRWILGKMLVWKIDLRVHPEDQMRTIFAWRHDKLDGFFNDFGFPAQCEQVSAATTPMSQPAQSSANTRPVESDYLSIRHSYRIKESCIHKYKYVGSNVLFIISGHAGGFVRAAFLSVPGDKHVDEPRANIFLREDVFPFGPQRSYVSDLKNSLVMFVAGTVSWSDIEGHEIGSVKDIHLTVSQGQALGKYFNKILGKFSVQHAEEQADIWRRAGLAETR